MGSPSAVKIRIIKLLGALIITVVFYHFWQGWGAWLGIGATLVFLG